MRRLLGGDHQNGMAILRAQAPRHVEDLAYLMNWLPNLAEIISKVLQAPGVLSNLHVGLDKVPELGFKIHGAVELIITELIMDRRPDDVRRGRGTRRMVSTSLGTELYSQLKRH